MSTNHDEKLVADRRDFLKLATIGTATSGIALVAGGGAAAEERTDLNGSGYQETGHVKAYYDLARF
ncbi:MAG: twin-arginine translocation signal domain-containing protein [Stappiaceae bacterium]